MACPRSSRLSGGRIGPGHRSDNQDNTAFGTTAAEFLLLGAGARGTALGGAFSAIATDVSALYYNPAGVALMARPGSMVGTYDYVADTRYTWGGIAFPFSGGSRAVGLQIGTFGFKDQPVYTDEQPDGTGSVYSVSETFVGLTLAQNFSDRFSAGITGKGIFDQPGQGERAAPSQSTSAPTSMPAERPPDPVLVRARQPRHEPELQRHAAADGDAPGSRSAASRTCPKLPDQSNLRTKDFNLPTIFRVGLAYDLITGDNNRLTVLGDFNQPNNNGAGFSVGGEWMSQKLGGSNFGFASGAATATPARTTRPSTPSPTALNDEENLQGLAFGGGLNYGRSTSIWASTTPGSIWAFSGGPISSASAWVVSDPLERPERAL